VGLTCIPLPPLSDVVFEKAYSEYRLNRVESALKTIEAAPEQTDKLKELYGQVVRLLTRLERKKSIITGCSRFVDRSLLGGKKTAFLFKWRIS